MLRSFQEVTDFFLQSQQFRYFFSKKKAHIRRYTPTDGTKVSS